MDLAPDALPDARVFTVLRAPTDPMARAPVPATPEFPARLATLRKAKGLTQQQLADLVALHVMQIHRYEAGASQPTLDVIRRLAVALSVSADTLVFGTGTRGPDDDLRLQFEAVRQFTASEKKILKTLLDALILTHQARRWTAAS